MRGNKGQSRGKRIFKGLSIVLIALLGAAAFLCVEVAMSGSDLNAPSQMRIWLLLVGGIVLVAGGLITVISRT